MLPPLSSSAAISSVTDLFLKVTLYTTIVSLRGTGSSHETKFVGHGSHWRNQQMLEIAHGGSMRHQLTNYSRDSVFDT